MAMRADIRAFALYLSSIGFFVLCDNGKYNTSKAYTNKLKLRIMAKKHKLELTELEMQSLISLLDTHSSLIEGVFDDGTAQKEKQRIDKMLAKNGYKRKHH